MKISQIAQQVQANSTQQASNIDKQKEAATIEKSAKDLEGLFLTFVLKAMEKTIPRESESSNNMASMMFSNVLGQGIADQGGIGLADFFAESMQQNSPKELAALKEKMQSPTNININTLRMNEE